MDDSGEAGFQPRETRWSKLALEHRVLEMVSYIAESLEHAAEPLVVADVVADDVGRAHQRPQWKKKNLVDMNSLNVVDTL